MWWDLSSGSCQLKNSLKPSFHQTWIAVAFFRLYLWSPFCIPPELSYQLYSRYLPSILCSRYGLCYTRGLGLGWVIEAPKGAEAGAETHGCSQLSCAGTRTLTHTHSHSDTHTLMHTHTLWHTHTHTLSHTHTHTHIHTHTHTQRCYQDKSERAPDYILEINMKPQKGG